MSEFAKGISRLALVPMRIKPDHESPMCSQVLFGEHYTILKSDRDWFYIQLYFDQSEGWIHMNQHTTISDAYFEQINHSDYKVCTDLSGTIFFQKKYVNILLGSILPITTNELFKIEEQVAFNGASKSLIQKREFEFLLSVIEKFRHAPYLPGGKTPFGVDESGFVQQIFKIAGYRLPRLLAAQASIGKSIESLDEVRPGDLVLVGNEYKMSTGFIFLGDNQYIGLIGGRVEKIANLIVDQDKVIIRRILASSTD